MTSYSSWLRVRPEANDDTIERGVEARVHDPLWLLARQWQMQEFCHDGGSSPVQVQIDGDCQRVSAMAASLQQGSPLNRKAVDPIAMPMAMCVEREAGGGIRLERLRLRFEAGLQFERMLKAQGLGDRLPGWLSTCRFNPAFRGELGLADNDASASWLRLVEGRRLDGALLWPRTDPNRPHSGGVVPAMTPEEIDEQRVVQAWRASVAQDFAPPGTPDTWNSQRQEHACALFAGGADAALSLSLPEYFGEGLDWYHFEQQPSRPGVLPPQRRTAFRVPMPLEFKGMPNPRFWTFEDSSTDFDAFESLDKRGAAGAQTSITSGMVVDFALSYSDDWFLVPLRLPAWSTFQTLRFEITDVFGDKVLATPPGGRWNLFRLDATGAPFGNEQLGQAFIVAGSSQANAAPAHEEVHLLRDEMANAAFAIEKSIPGADGRPCEIKPPAAAPATKAEDDGRWTWRLVPPSPPSNWFPLLSGPQPGMLNVGAFWSAPAKAGPRSVTVHRMMQPPGGLHAEEVPIEGVRVARCWKSARAVDGSLHFWIARSKIPGRDAVVSQLRFDAVEFE